MRAARLCAALGAGDVLLADRAYVDLSFLWDLDQRGVLFVLRMVTALWVKTDLVALLRCYGTAGGPHRPVLSAKEPFLPGFEAFSSSLVGQHG